MAPAPFRIVRKEESRESGFLAVIRAAGFELLDEGFNFAGGF
jgi:hypothetical protein